MRVCCVPRCIDVCNTVDYARQWGVWVVVYKSERRINPGMIFVLLEVLQHVSTDFDKSIKNGIKRAKRLLYQGTVVLGT